MAFLGESKEEKLARQAEEAKKIRDEELRIASQRQIVEELKKLCNSLQTGVKDCNTSIASLRSAVAQFPRADHFDGKFVAFDNQLSNILTSIVGYGDQFTKGADITNGSLQEIKAQIQAVVDDRKLYDEELNSMKSQIVRLNGEVQQYYDAYAKADKECERFRQELANAENRVEAKNSELDAANNEKSRLTSELADAQTKLSDEIAKHAEEIAAIRSEHSKAIEDIQRKHGEAEVALKAEFESSLAAANEEACQKLDRLAEQYGEAFPAEICELFDYHLGDEIKTALPLIYAYLGLIKGSLRPNLFTKAFQYFDTTLFDLLEGDGDALEDCRERIEKHLNAFAKANGCPICIEWPKPGSQFNADTCFAEGDDGMNVQRTLRAVIYSLNEDGAKKCSTKGRVETV